MFLSRVFNPKVKMSQRAYQVGNAAIEFTMKRSMNFAYVMEFPKCGGSWVRNMLRTYRETDLYSYDRLVKRNEVIMGHRLYSPRFSKAIVVVRDPRDVYVSFYHYENSYERSDQNSILFNMFKHDRARPLRDDFYEYLKVKLLVKTHPWFFYSQFLDSWLSRPSICVVRYEDCLKEPEQQLIRMLRFLDDVIDLDRIVKTVEETSFESITKKKYGAARKTGDADNSKFHRKGVIGDWKNHFNEEACLLLEKVDGPSIRRLGYETDSSWVESFLEERIGAHCSLSASR